MFLPSLPHNEPLLSAKVHHVAPSFSYCSPDQARGCNLQLHQIPPPVVSDLYLTIFYWNIFVCVCVIIESSTTPFEFAVELNSTVTAVSFVKCTFLQKGDKTGWLAAEDGQDGAGGSARSRYRCFDVQSQWQRLWHLQMSSPGKDSRDYTQLSWFIVVQQKKGEIVGFIYFMLVVLPHILSSSRQQWHQQAGPRTPVPHF